MGFREKINLNGDTLYPGMNMYMQMTIHRLAKFFSCESTIEAVVEKRNEYAQDFSHYTKNYLKTYN